MYQTFTMSAIHASYRRWRANREELDARNREQSVPDALTPEMTSMFKMTRGLVRLIMYYLKPSPPDGDLPGLIAKAVFGLSPEPDEMALIKRQDAHRVRVADGNLRHAHELHEGRPGRAHRESDDVRKIVLATVTAWKDSSTQRYLKGIVDTINAIHRDERGGDGDARRHARDDARARAPPTSGGTPGRRGGGRNRASMRSCTRSPCGRG